MTHLDMSGTDLDTLAVRLLADLDEARACLLASGDEDLSSVAPPEQSERVRDVWSRLRSLGEPQRGFLVVGGEMWAFVRRGDGVGLVIAAPSSTPGLLLDRLEMALRTAEDVLETDEVPAMAMAVNGDAESSAVDVSVLSPEDSVAWDGSTSEDEHPAPVEQHPAPVEEHPAATGGSGPAGHDVDQAALSREFAFLMTNRVEPEE